MSLLAERIHIVKIVRPQPGRSHVAAESPVLETAAR